MNTPAHLPDIHHSISWMYFVQPGQKYMLNTTLSHSKNWTHMLVGIFYESLSTSAVNIFKKYIQWNFSKPDPQKTVPHWISTNFFKSLLNNSLQEKSQKTGHPSKLSNFFGPNADRFREVSLYISILYEPMELTCMCMEVQNCNFYHANQFGVSISLRYWKQCH
jgi:hypothetical protein